MADATAAVREVVHELRSCIGTIRLALTTVAAADVDRAFRDRLLETADAETVRMSAELGAISALVGALGARRERVDLLDAVKRAASLARANGIRATVRGANAEATARGFEAALPALIALASAGSGGARIRCRDGTVAIVPSGEPRFAPSASLVRRLLEAIGAEHVPSASGIGFRFA